MLHPGVGQRFEELLSLMVRLRRPDGCPWDREQTRASLRPFLIEEAYEVLDALEREDPASLREELGDLLFQVVFHAQISAERGEFGMAELLTVLIDKMVRRHPHVFGDRTIESAADALAQWEALKQAERGGAPRSVLQGIPRSLPGLLRAQRIQHRASRVGFDWEEPKAALGKVHEEVAEVNAALREGRAERIGSELGDLLFAVVNVARLAQVDPEAALQGAVDRFRERFQRMEALADEDGRDLHALTLEEMESLWLKVKSQESPA